MEPLVVLENFDADHSEVSPSSAHRWIFCPGSVLLKRVLKLDGGSSEAAAEGTAAHWLAEEVLTKYPLEDRPEELATYEGELIRVSNTSESGETVTYDFIVCKDMIEHVLEYITLCQELAFGAEYERVEHKVDLTHLTSLDGKPTHGYIDHETVKDKTLTVLDFKYGKAVGVSPKDNPQLLLYAKGALDELSVYFEIDNIRLLISQPRKGGTSEHSITPEQLDLWVEAYVNPAVQEIKGGSDRLECDPDKQCRFCPVRNDCKLLADTILEGVFEKIPEGGEITLDNAKLKDLKVLTEKEKVAIFLMKGKISTWLGKNTAGLTKQAQGGKMPEGLKYVKGKSSRSWTDEAKAEKALGRQGFGVDVRRVPAKLKTPPAMEKIIGKKHRIMKAYVSKSEGAPTLVAVDDKREAITLDDGTSDFKKITSENVKNDRTE